ncbi:unnamed protein product [Protopolystoma xenopodis]|uniref:Uncharacterized protein n=1 Tax=Protopolystoma xenopodis TaxID=117903 RepID=A0A3S5CNH6_9PLAT|nr:unnamed protein product [Protopolystoma xenopodis]
MLNSSSVVVVVVEASEAAETPSARASVASEAVAAGPAIRAILQDQAILAHLHAFLGRAGQQEPPPFDPLTAGQLVDFLFAGRGFRSAQAAGRASRSDKHVWCLGRAICRAYLRRPKSDRYASDAAVSADCFSRPVREAVYAALVQTRPGARRTDDERAARLPRRVERPRVRRLTGRLFEEASREAEAWLDANVVPFFRIYCSRLAQTRSPQAGRHSASESDA